MKTKLPFLITFFLMLCFLSTNIFAQTNFDCAEQNDNSYSLCEHFAENNISNNWNGQVDSFTINENNQLMLNAIAAGTSYISSPMNFETNGDTEWRFYFNLDFAPSGSNGLRIYLTSNEVDLSSENINGYYFNIGESGSEDALDFYIQNGTESTLLLNGLSGAVADEPALFVKVIRSNSGDWEIFTASAETGIFASNGSVTDNTFSQNGHFGFLCKYTSGNITDAFFFDDVYVGQPIIDNTAPSVENIEVLNANTIVLTFSETVDVASAEDIGNYSSNISFSAANVSDENSQVVILTTTNSLSSGNYTLNINGISDLSGNTMNSQSLNFSYYIPNSYDVVISEFFVDTSFPSGFENPNLDIPLVKFVELYNRSESTVNLANWKFADINDESTLPSFELAANSFVVLCKSTDIGLFPADMPLIGLPSGDIDFKQENDTLFLYDANNNLIHAVMNYTKEWYRDDSKQEGGWTLEMIDTDNPCAGSENWRACSDSAGGTPAQTNSVDGDNADTSLPDLLSAEVANIYQVILNFSEPLSPQSVSDISQYSIDENLNISYATLNETNPTQVILDFATPISENVLYTLTVTNITDCVGNALGMFNTAQFGLGLLPEAGDIVINEILADPATGGSDFIEIYNTTDKILDLSTMCFANADLDVDADSIENFKAIGNYSILPHQYVTVSSDIAYIKSYYSQCGTNLDGLAFIQADLPTYSADEGVVFLGSCLYTTDGLTLDNVHYLDDWHNELLDITKGVSLERIDKTADSNDENNWESAVSGSCYATPSYQNTNTRIAVEQTGTISVEPKSFSPDGAGEYLFTQIFYELDEPNYSMNIMIYDERGREINHLVKSEIVGQADCFKWNGTTENGDKAPIGIYVVYVEIFNPEGDLKSFKETCVVGGKLD